MTWTCSAMCPSPAPRWPSGSWSCSGLRLRLGDLVPNRAAMGRAPGVPRPSHRRLPGRTLPRGHRGPGARRTHRPAVGVDRALLVRLRRIRHHPGTGTATAATHRSLGRHRRALTTPVSSRRLSRTFAASSVEASGRASTAGAGSSVLVAGPGRPARARHGSVGAPAGLEHASSLPQGTRSVDPKRSPGCPSTITASPDPGSPAFPCAGKQPSTRSRRTGSKRRWHLGSDSRLAAGDPSRQSPSGR